jgi:hypothetical protein
VFWRLLVIQSRIYHGIIRTWAPRLDRPRTDDDVVNLCLPMAAVGFPLGDVDPAAEIFEPMSATRFVSDTYIRLLLAPKLLLSI